MAVVKEERYILTNVGNNNNKWWEIREYDDGTVETKWGRVGEPGQTQRKSRPRGFFEQKCSEKREKGYVPQRIIGGSEAPKTIERSQLERIAREQIDAGSQEAQDLISRLARENKHNILSATTLKYDDDTGLFRTPLGIVDADAIKEARTLLTKIGDMVMARQWDTSQFASTVNSYMMLIPRDIGRGRPNLQHLWPTLESVRKDNAILDSLEASIQMVLSKPIVDEPEKPVEQVFQVKLWKVEGGNEIDAIRKLYHSTLHSGHISRHLDVKRVFSVEIRVMWEAFTKRISDMQGPNVKKLWHGTRVGNLLSILKGGLIIPPSNAPHCTGRMFGNGIYFSDQSTKSLNYSYGYWSGSRDENCFMFLCSVAMGKEFIPTGPSQSLPKPGYDSTFAKASQSGVMNNEMIVYNTNQANLDYLIEFSPNGR